MHTFDTCESCGTYYVTQDRDVLTSREQGYIPEDWSNVEVAWQGVPKCERTIATFGQCYVCGEVNDLRYQFTV